MHRSPPSSNFEHGVKSNLPDSLSRLAVSPLSSFLINEDFWVSIIETSSCVQSLNCFSVSESLLHPILEATDALVVLRPQSLQWWLAPQFVNKPSAGAHFTLQLPRTSLPPYHTG